MINVTSTELHIVQTILQKYVPTGTVLVFGSRLHTPVKKHADLDLVIICDKPLDQQVLFYLIDAFQESDLPFRVDIIDWQQTSPNFHEIILKEYEVLQRGDFLQKISKNT